MSLLPDTHVVLWWLLDDAALSDDLKAHLDDDPDVWVSAVSAWEVAIKEALGKLNGPQGLAEEVARSGFRGFRSPSTTRWPPGASPCCTATRSTACWSHRPVSRT